MFISRKLYQLELDKRYADGQLAGESSILDLIRRSETINIVHGDFSVESDGALRNSTVFVVPKNIGVYVGEKSKNVVLSQNYIAHKPSG